MTTLSTKEEQGRMNVSLSQENAVLLLENISLKERMDHESWDLRQMKSNVQLMKKISDSASWKSETKASVQDLTKAMDELLVIIQNKDATLVVAGHTHLEHALREVRISTFGV